MNKPDSEFLSQMTFLIRRDEVGWKSAYEETDRPIMLFHQKGLTQLCRAPGCIMIPSFLESETTGQDMSD